MTNEKRPDPFGATALEETAIGRALGATSPESFEATVAVSSGQSGPTSQGPASVGLRPFGPFTQVEALAEQGAMGVVARGYNAAFDRWELLKFLRIEHTQHPELVRQFHREGRILAKLSHPNVVQVFAIYALDGQPCLAMEFLEGESLQAHAAKHGGKLPIDRWYELFLAAARGMAAAHDVGLLHRDIKPENLFVMAERKGGVGLKLIDFGLATADRSRRDLASRDPSLVAAMSGGTPLYMAPELWRQQDASPRSDIYALGVTFFAAATGKLPYAVGRTAAEVAMAVCDERPFPDARDTRPDLPAAMAMLLRRAIAKHPEERFASADELVASLAAAAHEARTRKIPGSGPYRGLGSFSAAERDVFFGRDTEIAEALERLRAQGGLVMVGPSGSGKSSLAHAGLVPAIEEGALGGGLVYRAASFEPRAHPLTSLAAALARLTGSTEKDLLAFLRATPEQLGEALRGGLPPGAGALLVIDQLEEIATLAEDRAEVRGFARAIGSLLEVAAPEIRLLATLRADLMDRLFDLEPLRPLLTRGFYPVRPLLGEALRGALTGPAQAAGYSLEDPAIADAIVADVARTEAGLPLLSFAMAAWWQARDEARKILPTAAWKALGGLTGALIRHGDGVLDGMSRDERAAAEQILVRLVTADGTRSRVARSSLVDPAASGPNAARALERLLQSKLLLESAGDIELVHEALISQWPALRMLLQSSGEDRAFRERVSAAAREWDAQGRPDGALWSDDQAARLLRWFSSTGTTLGQLELAFLEAVRRRINTRKLLLRSLVFALLASAVTFSLHTKAQERQLNAALASTSARLVKLEAEFRRAEGSRLRSLAERQLTEDPSRSLASAFESYEKLPDPSLDLIAWQARYRGLAYPLPLHKKGATLAAIAPTLPWVATAGLDGSVHVLSVKDSGHEMLRASKVEGAVARSLAFGAEALAIGTSAGEVVAAVAPRFAPLVIGRCPGSVEQLRWLTPRVFVARCVDKASSKVVRVDIEDKTLSDLAQGDIIDVAASKAGTHVAWKNGKIQTFGFPAAPGPTDFSSPLLPAIADLALSPDGDTLFASAPDGALFRAPLVSGKIKEIAAFGEKLSGASLALGAGPLGSVVAIGPDRVARLWLNKRVHSFDVGGTVVGWARKRNLLFLEGRSHDVLVISVLSGEVVGRLLGATAEITSIRASDTWRWLLVTSRDGGVRAYSLDDAAAYVNHGPLAAAPTACAVSQDGTAYACVAGPSVQTERMAGSAGGPKEPPTLTLPKDARPTLLALTEKGEQIAWAAPGAWAIGAASLSGLARPLALAASSRTVALAGKDADGGAALLLADAKAPGEPRPVKLDEHPTALAFSRDGARLFAATEEGNVLLVDPGTASIIRVRPIDRAKLEAEPSAIAVSDDGDHVAVGSRSGAVFTFVIDGKAEKSLPKLGASIACLSWTQSARALVAATGETRRLSLLDLETGQALVVGGGSAAPVGCSRSPIDDRFSFVLADGSAFLRMLDVAPLTMSKPPEPALDPRTMPAEQWRGFPTVWR